MAAGEAACDFTLARSAARVRGGSWCAGGESAESLVTSRGWAFSCVEVCWSLRGWRAGERGDVNSPSLRVGLVLSVAGEAISVGANEASQGTLLDKPAVAPEEQA